MRTDQFISAGVVAWCMFVGGCASDGDDDDNAGAVCGNSVCQAGESATSCPADCDEGGPVCAASDPTSCGGETICIGGACLDAFGRAYTITVVDAAFPQFGPDGDTWDAVGGAPDGFVVVSLNGVEVVVTTTVQDNLTPTWNQASSPTVIAAGSTLTIDVYDEDVAANDYAFGCEANPLTADFLRSGGIVCEGAAGAVAVAFDTN